MRMKRVFACAAACLTMSACASVAPVGQDANVYETRALAADEINWPAQYRPEDATFYLRNEIDIAAPPDVVWRILIDAETWPEWYRGASNVDVLDSDTGELGPNAVFTWRTMNLNSESRVTEFEPPYRLSWESRKASLLGYHAWCIVPTENGSQLITDESQYGFLANMQRIFIPNSLSNLHDEWLSQIKQKAEAVQRQSS